MNPFYFGDSVRPLYGVHHPPRGTRARRAGVVLCYPFAQEYMRAHRAFRQLALLLSGAGFHTLRFDWSGTGDSAGDADAITLAAWQEDLRVAVDELLAVAAVQSVWLVGLRLGAAIALRGASHPAVEGVVLWDPVVAGNALLTEATPAGAGMLELGGNPIPTSLRADLAAVRMPDAPVKAGLRALIAVAEERDYYQALASALRDAGGTVAHLCVPSDGRWGEFDNWGSALIPQALIRTIVDHLNEQAA